MCSAVLIPYNVRDAMPGNKKKMLLDGEVAGSQLTVGLLWLFALA